MFTVIRNSLACCALHLVVFLRQHAKRREQLKGRLVLHFRFAAGGGDSKTFKLVGNTCLTHTATREHTYILTFTNRMTVLTHRCMFDLEMNLENFVLCTARKAGKKNRSSTKKSRLSQLGQGKHRTAPKRNLPANHWKSVENSKGQSEMATAAKKYAMVNVIHNYRHTYACDLMRSPECACVCLSVYVRVSGCKNH